MSDSQPPDKRSWMARHRTSLGFAGTVLYVAAVVWWTDLRQFPYLNPNELGDFLGGVVGPVAFFWLILGYFQQGDELRLNSRALELQAKELAHQVEETRKLAEAAAAQTELQGHRLELERESVAFEMARVKNERQPDFTLASTHIQGRSMWGAMLRNEGQTANDVGVRVMQDDREIMGQHDFGRMGNGEERRLSVTVDDSGSHEVSVVINFYDIDQERRRVVLNHRWSQQ